MSLFFIEIFLCFAICFIVFRCCGRMLLLQQQQQLQHELIEQQQQQQQTGMGDGNSSDLDDLRRLRERIGGRRRGSRSSSAVTVSESDLAARKELIHQNLFTRQINREASVMELSLLLAISRGGGYDVGVMEEEDIELGRRSGIASNELSSNSERKLSEENDDEERDNTPSYTEMTVPTLPSNSPAPSAPPMPTIEVTPGAETTTSIATPRATSTIRRIWRSLSQRQQSDTTIILDSTTQQPQPQPQPQQANNNNNTDMGSTRTIHNSVSLSSSSLRHPNKIECSICLEQYSPNDIIAWAKDGGGDTPLPSSSSGNAASSFNTGCDHIFHRECLVAWLLQDHDECPLCRRRVIHADAHVRFAGWDER